MRKGQITRLWCDPVHVRINSPVFCEFFFLITREIVYYSHVWTFMIDLRIGDERTAID